MRMAIIGGGAAGFFLAINLKEMISIIFFISLCFVF